MLAFLYSSLSNMKLFRKVVLALITLVLLVSCLLWGLTKMINPDQVRDFVNSQLTKLTGQDSHADGEINWQIFPQPGLTIKKITVGDKNDAKHYQLTINNLLFNLKIAPLFSGQLVFNEIKVHGFQLTINSDGLEPTEELKRALNSSYPTPLHQRFAIARFLLTDGKINLTDKNQTIDLSKLQMALDGLNFDGNSFPIHFKANFNISEDQHSVGKGVIQFKGNTLLSPKFLKNPLANLNDLAIDGQLLLQDLRFKQLRIKKISANSYLKKKVLSLNPLTVKLYNGEAMGDLVYYIDDHKLFVNQTGTGLDSAKFSYDLFSKKMTTGLLDFSLHSESNLQEKDWLINSIAKGVVTIKNGTLESINLSKIIDNLTTKVNTTLDGKDKEIKQLLKNGQFDNPEYFTGATPFKVFTMQQRLQQQKLMAETLVLQTSALIVKGQGQLNLTDYALNGNLTASVINSSGQVALIQQLLGGSFPLLIEGTATNPVVLPNLKIINPLLTKVWLKSTLEKPIKLLQQFKAVLTP